MFRSLLWFYKNECKAQQSNCIRKVGGFYRRDTNLLSCFFPLDGGKTLLGGGGGGLGAYHAMCKKQADLQNIELQSWT